MQRARECTDLRLPCIFSLIRGSPAREYTDRNIVRVNLRTSVNRKANQIPWQSMHAPIRVFRWEFRFDQRTGHLSNPVCNRWMRPVIIINRSSGAAWKSRDVQSERHAASPVDCFVFPRARARAARMFTRVAETLSILGDDTEGGISARIRRGCTYVRTHLGDLESFRSRGLCLGEFRKNFETQNWRMPKDICKIQIFQITIVKVDDFNIRLEIYVWKILICTVR